MMNVTNATTLYILGIAISATINSRSRTTSLPPRIEPSPLPPRLGSPWKCSRLCLSTTFTGFANETSTCTGNKDKNQTKIVRKRSRKSIVNGNAFDIIFFHHETNSSSYIRHNSNFVVTFPLRGMKTHDDVNRKNNNTKYHLILEISGEQDDDDDDDVIWIPVMHNHQSGDSSNDMIFRENVCCQALDPGSSNDEDEYKSNKSYESMLLPFLKQSSNNIRYILFERRNIERTQEQTASNSSHTSYNIRGIANAHLHLWSPVYDKIVVVDIDGTITLSNGKVWDTVIRNQWSACCHEGVASFLTELRQEQNIQEESTSAIRYVYLTSRPVRFVGPTRNFITQYSQTNSTDEQADSSSYPQPLPDGALLGFPGSTLEMFYVEFIRKKSYLFKSHTLWDQVVITYQLHGHPNEQHSLDRSNYRNPFVAGFGNSWTDIQAYHRVGVPLDKVYKINASSTIIVWDRIDIGENGEGDNLDSILTGSLDMELMNNTFTKTWYKTRVGSSFEGGYADSRLLAHVVSQSSLASPPTPRDEEE